MLDAGATSHAAVRRSRGFEGLALDVGRGRLVAALESGPAGDPAGTTRLLESDLAARRFSGRAGTYRASAPDVNVTEFVTYAPERYLAIERDDAAGEQARLKCGRCLTPGEVEGERGTGV